MPSDDPGDPLQWLANFLNWYQQQPWSTGLTGPISRFYEVRHAKAVSNLLNAVAVKQIASTLNAPLNAQLTESADSTISAIIDVYCGTPPGPPKPNDPWGVPPAAALDLAATLVIFAGTSVQWAPMQAELLSIAGQLTTRAFAAATAP